MKTVLVILNHDLTATQINDLLAWGEAVELTPEQRNIWSQIPATGDKRAVAKHISPITGEIRNHDVVVCQGEFSAFAEVLSWCIILDKPLLVACSQRETQEQVEADGSTKKVAVFRHVQFRAV